MTQVVAASASSDGDAALQLQLLQLPQVKGQIPANQIQIVATDTSELATAIEVSALAITLANFQIMIDRWHANCSRCTSAFVHMKPGFSVEDMWNVR